jgi:hypothetical protein
MHDARDARLWPVHPYDFDSSIFLASRIGFITSHRVRPSRNLSLSVACGRHRCQPASSKRRLRDLRRVSGWASAFPLLSVWPSTPMFQWGIIGFVGLKVHGTKRWTGQRVFMRESPSPQTTYYCHEENTKVNFVKLANIPCGIRQMSLIARSHIPSDLYRLVFTLDAVNIQRYTDCLGLVAF